MDPYHWFFKNKMEKKLSCTVYTNLNHTWWEVGQLCNVDSKATVTRSRSYLNNMKTIYVQYMQYDRVSVPNGYQKSVATIWIILQEQDDWWY